MPEKNRERRRKRREYLENFHTDLNGEYVYEGEYYRYAGEALPYGRLKKRLGALCAAMLLAQVAAGCVPAAGMNGKFYVIMPYALCLVSTISVCWAMARLRQGGERLRAYVYEATVKALPGRALLTLVLSALCIAGELISLLSGGVEISPVGSAAFLLLHALTLLSALMIRRLLSACRWVKEK